jgi:hypothetical protein
MDRDARLDERLEVAPDRARVDAERTREPVDGGAGLGPIDGPQDLPLANQLGIARHRRARFSYRLYRRQ